MKLALLAPILASLLATTGCISNELRAIDDNANPGVSDMTVIAHRGASAYAPESTFAAFDKAQQLGAVAIATDLQLSKDGRVVIFHDDTLDKKTALTGSVHDHLWSELTSQDLAPWFAKTHAETTGEVKTDAANAPKKVATNGTASSAPSKKAKAGAAKKTTKRSAAKETHDGLPTNALTHLITLDDLFERYGMTFSYNLELVNEDDGLADAALKVVRDYGVIDNVTFTSFYIDQLLKIHKLDKDIPLTYLIDDKKTPNISAEIARSRNLGFDSVSVRAAIVTADQVKTARASGIKLICWGAKSDDDMKRAVQAGVAGMTTDWPDRLMKLLQTPLSR